MTTPIDFDLATTVRTGHIHARLRTVELTPEVAESFLREARNTMIDARTMRLMVEFELAHALSEAGAYEVMSQCVGVMSGSKVAFVNRDPKHHQTLSLCARFSQEFGHDFGYFTDCGPAAEWLLEP